MSKCKSKGVKDYKGKPVKMKMNRRGQFNLIVTLLFIFMAVIFLVMLIPGIADIIDLGLAPDSLNCRTSATYNATLGERSSMGCLGLTLFIPFLVLGTLAVLIQKLFYGDRVQQPPMYQGYQ